MAEQEIEVVEELPFEDSNTFLDGLRRILLAGIGVVVLAQEEIEDFVNKLVDRGEIAETDGRTLVTDVLERRKNEGQESLEVGNEEMDSRVEMLLKRLNVPTKSEITALSDQIDELSKKVDQLREISE